MTERQIEQIKAQLPEGESIERMYLAYEGDIRVITKDQDGSETRYTTHMDSNCNVTIERM